MRTTEVVSGLVQVGVFYYSINFYSTDQWPPTNTVETENKFMAEEESTKKKKLLTVLSNLQTSSYLYLSIKDISEGRSSLNIWLKFDLLIIRSS